MQYYNRHLRQLTAEACNRFDRLQFALRVSPNPLSKELVDIDGMVVRLAVDDFKAILAEIRKLK